MHIQGFEYLLPKRRSVGLAPVLLLALVGTGCPGDDVPMVPTEDSSTGEATTTGTATQPTVGPTTTPPGETTEGMTTEAVDTTEGMTTGDLCGNGALDAGEECDGTELDGADCMSQGFLDGDLACNDDCTFDTTACVDSVCGNGAIEGDEACDTDDLAGEDCLSLGYDEGTLACAKDCTALDESMCIMWSCGNDIIEGPEICDNVDLAGEDCISQGFDGGTLACNAMNCMSYDTTGCFVCGDDVIGGMEVCDGTDVGAEDCTTQGFDGGTLGCAADCGGYDTSGCFSCGDGVINGMEQCEGADLGGADCTTEGFLYGTLSCDGACAFDTSACTNVPMFCSTPGSAIGPNAGVLTQDTLVVPALGAFVTDVNVYVDASHTWVGDLDVDIRHVDSDTNLRMMETECGNIDNILVTFDQDAGAPPACAPPIGGGMNAQPFVDSLEGFSGLPDGAGTWEISFLDNAGGDGGTLNEWCVVFETGPDPTVCGDGVRTFGEQCDGADLGGATCTDVGYLNGGTLACNGACAFDTSMCDASEGLCGDQIISNDGIAPDEECDTNELAQTRCEDLGFLGGSLDCSAPSCGFDTSECSNGVVVMCAAPGAPLNGVSPMANSTITLANMGNVADVDVFVNIDHVWIDDIDMFLSNDGTGALVELSTDQCGSGDDLWAFYNDEGNGPPDCDAPIDIEGNITPEGVLGDFDGLPIAGDWTLQVTDDFPGADDGVLNEWCIYITPA